MAFTVGAVAAKDGAAATIGGGLLAADVAGGGVGPWFLYNGIVDGIAGSTKLGVYAEDAAAASDPTGTMMLAVRRDTLSTSEVSTDGDNIALKATSKGKLHVAAELRSGDTAIAVGAGAADAATMRVTMDTGQVGSLLSTAFVMSANYVPVGLPTDQVWGVGATGFTKLEDAASADGDKGVPAMAIQRATPADAAGTDLDYSMLQMKDGRLYVRATIEDISNGEWETVAASSSNQVLGTSGAIGDYLGVLWIVPASTSPGAVTICDGSSSPDTQITVFAGGASSLSNLAPFPVALGIKSLVGGWRVTTGSNVSAIGVGNFT